MANSKIYKPDIVVMAKLVLLAWFTVIGMMAWVSLAPGLGATSAYHIDKVLHLGVYLVLGGVPAFVLPRISWSLLAALFLIGVGILLELGQSFVMGRVASVEDAAANVLGAALGVMIAINLRQRLQPR